MDLKVIKYTYEQYQLVLNEPNLIKIRVLSCTLQYKSEVFFWKAEYHLFLATVPLIKHPLVHISSIVMLKKVFNFTAWATQIGFLSAKVSLFSLEFHFKLKLMQIIMWTRNQLLFKNKKGYVSRRMDWLFSEKDFQITLTQWIFLMRKKTSKNLFGFYRIKANFAVEPTLSCAWQNLHDKLIAYVPI